MALPQWWPRSKKKEGLKKRGFEIFFRDERGCKKGGGGALTPRVG
jgi:hypothetical protein